MKSSHFFALIDQVRERLVHWFGPGEITPQWNIWNLYREIAWYGVYSGVTGTFVGILTVRLDASPFMVGLLTSLPALIALFWQIPAARWIERLPDMRRTLLWSLFLQRLPILLIALVPFVLRGSAAAAAVVLLTIAANIPGAIAGVAFTSLMADIVEPRDRAHVLSMRQVVLAITSTLSVLLAGPLLDWLPFPSGYQLILMASFACGVVSLYYTTRLAMPRYEVARRSSGPGVGGWSHSIRLMLKERGYVRFVIASFIFHIGSSFPVPLYTIFRVNTLGLSDSALGLLSTVQSAMTIIGYYFWGRYAERRGSSTPLFFGSLASIIYPLGHAISMNMSPLVTVAAMGGIAGAATGLGIGNVLLEVTPSHHRATYVAVFNTLMNVATFIAPVLGTVFAGWVGIRAALVIAGVTRVLGFFSFLLLMGSEKAVTETMAMATD